MFKSAQGDKMDFWFLLGIAWVVIFLLLLLAAMYLTWRITRRLSEGIRHIPQNLNDEEEVKRFILFSQQIRSLNEGDLKNQDILLKAIVAWVLLFILAQIFLKRG